MEDPRRSPKRPVEPCHDVDNGFVDNRLRGDQDDLVSANDIDVALTALADPTRRRVVELLVDAPRRTGELAESIGVSVPAVSRHLRVLREHGVVERYDVDGDGRGRRYRLHPAGLAPLSGWLGETYWADRLGGGSDPGSVDVLARIGEFLDAFASGDVAFFERHLATDVELIFAATRSRWDRAATIDSVAAHPPYDIWDIAEAATRSLAPGITLATIRASVRTVASAHAASVVQTMIFDDTADPWTLRFLQQSDAG